MLRTRNLTLTSEPTLLTISDGVDSPNTISVQNTDTSATVYVGDSLVSSIRYGIKLSPGQVWSADLNPYDKLYAAGAGTASVLILER